MSQGVPIFGVWNKPNAEEIGFTGNFDMVRQQVRRDKPYMDHIRFQPAMDPQLPKRPATSSGISERMRNEGEIWETQSAKDPTEDFETQVRKSQRPPRPIERSHDLPPTKNHNRTGETMKNEKYEFLVQYDKGEIWETQSAESPPENFVLQIRQSQKPPIPIERRHEFSHTKQQNRIGEIMRNDKSQFPVRYDKGETWETQSAGDPSENFVPQIRQSRKPSVPIERRHELSHKKQHDIIGERMRNGKSQFAVGYDRGEIWETQSDKSPFENFVPQIRQSPRPTVPNERRHDLPPANNQNILTCHDDSRGRHERPRTGTSSGSAGASRISPPEARHHQLPSSSSDGSKRGLLSSGEEELMAKETNAMHRKPKGPTAPPYGKWIVDLNCTQEYTVKFAAVRNEKENRVVQPSVNPTPPVQPLPAQVQQKYYRDTRQQKPKKGKQPSCLGFLFPKVKRM